MSNTSYVYFGLIAVLAAAMIYWSIKHPEFKITDLVTGDNGQVSLRKFSALVALCSSTWGFVALVEQGKLSEWYFTAYIGVWAAQKVASDVSAAIAAPKA